jgi:hypothetical protein
MLFNSVAFIIFFILVTAGYFILPHRFRWALLLLASAYFYAAFIPWYLLILVFLILVDFFLGLQIEKAKGARRKHLLYVSILSNVGTLFIFKYYNFFVNNFEAIAAAPIGRCRRHRKSVRRNQGERVPPTCSMRRRRRFRLPAPRGFSHRAAMPTSRHDFPAPYLVPFERRGRRSRLRLKVCGRSCG